MNPISIQTAPRDPQELQGLKMNQLLRLATQLHLLDEEQAQVAFMGMTLDQKANEVARGLQAYDQQHGGQPTPQTAPPHQPQPQQYQQPAPPPQQHMPPQAPPPQVQTPYQQQPQASPHMPPTAAPPQQSPQPPQPNHLPPPTPPVAVPPQPPQPQQYQQPPGPPQQAYQQPPTPPGQPVPPPPQQHMPHQPPQAPQPPVPGTPQPQHAPPPPVPQQAVRQPQTAGDPNNAGNTISEGLMQATAGLQRASAGIERLHTDVSHVLEVQKVILKSVLALSSSNGAEHQDLARLASMYDDETLRAFMTQVLGSSGK